MKVGRYAQVGRVIIVIKRVDRSPVTLNNRGC